MPDEMADRVLTLRLGANAPPLGVGSTGVIWQQLHAMLRKIRWFAATTILGGCAFQACPRATPFSHGQAERGASQPTNQAPYKSKGREKLELCGDIPRVG